MKNKFEVNTIGKTLVNDEGFFIKIENTYITGLNALDGFSHLIVLWWFNKSDSNKDRTILTMQKPYKKAPEVMGTFATRSPLRPNPIAISIINIKSIDYENGIIQTDYFDADNESPILDIKPYTPSIDKVKNVEVPEWCAHWPKCVEDSDEFDWKNEFLF